MQKIREITFHKKICQKKCSLTRQCTHCLPQRLNQCFLKKKNFFTTPITMRCPVKLHIFLWKVISRIFCGFQITVNCVWSNEWVVFCCCQRDFEIFLTATTVKWLNCWGGKKCRATTYIQGRNYFFHSTLFRVNFLEFLSQKIRCCWVLVLNEAFP